MKLSEFLKQQPNNLNLVKLIAAILVMITHAYAYGRGYQLYDWYELLTKKEYSLGTIAVLTFFFYSGLLITKSILRHPSPKDFVWRRLRRIYPSYVVVLLFIVFLSGPIISEYSPGEYMSHPGTYRYLSNLLFIPCHTLPGVFISNAFDASVNGPIWTIRLELVCYVITLCCLVVGLLKPKKIFYTLGLYGLFLVGMIGCYQAGFLSLGTFVNVLLFLTMYYEGMIFAILSDYITIKPYVFYMALAVFVLFQGLGWYELSFLIALPWILLWCGFGWRGQWKMGNRLGSASYEIYLWGGFVGQLVCYAFGGYMNEHMNMLLTIPISILLGLGTHALVEETLKTLGKKAKSAPKKEES
ncbi:MAG: acyltransferase [Lachnospiraceae bacterium]|nr:acyltransferase [Lachnospiraceae bacterium]